MGDDRSVIRVCRSWLIAMMVFCAVGTAGAQPAVAPNLQAPSDAARQKELERDAAANLSLAKKSIQEDAFSNAKVMLNVWKVSAVEAGTFDRKVYDDLKRQLYDKSVKENLRCIESAIAQRDVPEANLCLRIYRLHATEIGVFDAKRHDELKARIAAIRRKGK